MSLIPARYVGEHPILLRDGGRMRDGFGKPLSSNALAFGETLMMPDTEVLGMTYKRRQKGSDIVDYLGVGRIVLPEHVGLSDDVLTGVYGYQFHEGRSDFVPLIVDAPAVESAPKTKKAATSPPTEG